MSLTVDQLIKELAEVTGAQPDLNATQRSNLYDALQGALDMIDTHRDWRFLNNTSYFTTVASPTAQAYYNLPELITDIGTVKRLWIPAAGQQLDPISIDDYIDQYSTGGAESTGYARAYWYEGGDNRIRIYPTPHEAYQIYVYYKRHHGDVRKNCTIYIPDKFKLLVRHLAKQIYKGNTQSLDVMLAGDPFVSLLWQQMITNESEKDVRAGRRRFAGCGFRTVTIQTDLPAE